MKLYFSDQFKALLKRLPPSLQDQVKKAFKHLAVNPSYNSLHFKRVGKQYSIRIDRNYRALGDMKDIGIVWDWIGPHDEYMRRIKRK